MGTMIANAAHAMAGVNNSSVKGLNSANLNTVVQFAEIGNGIAEITMQDTTTKNSLSADLTDGLQRSFRQAAESERYKVVILTGYGNYFLSGGTKEMLHTLKNEPYPESWALDLIRMIVDCPLPVIAAMQGHGIGAGFVLGLHADLIVLAKESIYTTNFLKYGFTPGMGATLVVPTKFGPILGTEMLFSARNYHGGQLAERGVAFPVLPRQEVLPYARQLAQDIADAPRTSLIHLKQMLTATWRATLDDKVRNEMAVLVTTVRQPGIEDRIENRFGQ